MPKTPAAENLAIGNLQQLKAALLEDAAAEWPNPGEVDAAGLQFIVSALRSGIVPPDYVLNAPAVRTMRDDLGLGAFPAPAAASDVTPESIED